MSKRLKSGQWEPKWWGLKAMGREETLLKETQRAGFSKEKHKKLYEAGKRYWFEVDRIINQE